MNSFDDNDPGTFRELSLPDLKEYAQRWARKYSYVPVLRILLYRHSSKFQKLTSPNKRLPYKYAVIFEVSDNVQCTFKSYDGINIGPTGSYSLEEHEKLLPNYSEAYEKLVIATEQYSTVRQGEKYLDLIDARFKEVSYKQRPGDNFEDDWSFKTKEPDEDLDANVLINEPHWILYGYRLSIKRISGALIKDQIYYSTEFIQDKIDFFINKYWQFGRDNSNLEKDQKIYRNKELVVNRIHEISNSFTIQEKLLHVLCCIGNLSFYQPCKKIPIQCRELDCLEKLSSSNEINHDDFREVLESVKLPLPSFWFEGEKNNTQEVVNNNLIENLKDIVTDELPKFDLDASIEDARRDKYIALGLLPYVMAADEQYSPDLLIRLWKKYQCDRRGPKEPPVETYENRVGVWYHLFERLAYGRVQGIPIKRSSPPYLPLYHFNVENGVLEKYDRRIDPGNPQVKFLDLKKYLTETIEIPLPTHLFPDYNDNETNVGNNKKIAKKELLPCASGTKWEDIKITLIANDTVRIRTPEGEERFTYHELGLSDKRKGDSPKILWPLLVHFAKNIGELHAKENNYTSYLPDQTKRLNYHLRKLFGINDSIYKGHYKKYKGYKTKIQFSDATQAPIVKPSPKSFQEEVSDEFDEVQNKFQN